MKDNLELRLESMLSYIENSGSEGFDDSKIEELEAIILDCNSLMSETYTNQVADSIWDTLYGTLKEVNSSSPILSDIWEKEGDIEEYTDLLQKNPMMSIETAKSYSCEALDCFIDRMPTVCNYFASYKINGHGIRVVWDNGVLVSATTRARSSAGKDITRHMQVLLGTENELLAEYGVVEIRGELCLPINRLAKAREYNPNIVSAFSAVASMSRPSATDEEILLLDFLAYGMIIDGFEFEEKVEEYQTLESAGFNVPDYSLLEEVLQEDLLDTIKAVVDSFEENYEEFGYFCDGVVFEVNERNLFRELGTEGNHNLGNVALKVGVWEQVQYCGYVQKILWTKGKTKLTPVALVAAEPYILEEDEYGKIQNNDELGVLTAQGNKVRRVPLYEPKNILILSAYIGEPIYFRYGGEAGVVPCFADGRLLKEDVVNDILLEGTAPWDINQD